MWLWTVAATTGGASRLSNKTICMNTKLGENGEFLTYQVHNLYGYSQSIATQRFIWNKC